MRVYDFGMEEHRPWRLSLMEYAVVCGEEVERKIIEMLMTPDPLMVESVKVTGIRYIIFPTTGGY